MIIMLLTVEIVIPVSKINRLSAEYLKFISLS
jgi:hypothetical protein